MHKQSFMEYESEHNLEEQSLEQSHKRTRLSIKRTKLSLKRTKLSEERRNLALQRTHLANHRTFQAWIRTGLALIGLGFGIAKFLYIESEKKDLVQIHLFNTDIQLSLTIGLGMIIVGIILTIIAYIRFCILEKRIGRDFKISYPWTSLLIVLCILIGGTIFLIDIFYHL